jgi:hypothetical protein
MIFDDDCFVIVGLVGVGGSFCGPYTSHIPSFGSEHKPKLFVDETSAFAYAFVASNAFAKTIGSAFLRRGDPHDESIPHIDAILAYGRQSYQAVTKGFGLVY